MRYRALILDMDGTLLDSREMIVHSLEVFAAEFNVTMTAQNYKTALGGKAEDLMEELNMPDVRGTANRWRAIMEELLDMVRPFDGVRAILEAPVRRGVVTSQSRQELDLNLARLGWRDAFEFTVGVDDTPYHKPHPYPLQYCLERMGVAVEEALFVGDSQYDYKCAQAAGVDFGLAVWGADRPEDFPKATYLFSHLEEILKLSFVSD